MIVKRYGTSYESVAINFDAKALNEVGFRRNRGRTIPVDGFDDEYSLIEMVELTADADGYVQNETEQLLLDRLRAKIEELVARLPEGGVLVVENESGHDYPKTRQQTKNVVEKGENRLYFEYSMKPALRVASYRLGG